METIQVAPSKELDQRMLNLYSQGLPYYKIQGILKKEFNEDFSKLCLGEYMGDLKKRMKCATQFEMGYIYAQDSISEVFEDIQEDHKIKLEEECKESFFRGLTFGRDQSKIMNAGKETVDGVRTGVLLSSIFWIIIVVSAYYLYLA